MKELSSKILFFLVVLVVLGQAGCGGSAPADHSHDHTHDEPHHHEPPHGGAGVTLGNEAAHIEFLVNGEAGTVTVWFYKPHMANFLRMKLESFEVLAKRKGEDAKLVFEAKANPVTGETVGDTSEFLAKADWLSDASTFDAVLPEITVLGKVYRNVAFNYPKGN